MSENQPVFEQVLSKRDPREKPLTDFQQRALESLAAGGCEGYSHWELYRRLFPNGRFNTDMDVGSSKGGPSRVDCAVNWHLGKLGPLARRTIRLGGFPGNWVITEEGREALRIQRGEI